MMNPPDRLQSLRQLQEIDFVMLELNLYLDTHPCDLRAIQQFNGLSGRRAQIRQAYEAQFGPLYHFGLSYNRYPNGWNEGPWPWEV
jgi:spore coat protein JB